MSTANSNERVFYAPGRVNLIGEYTDFNGGLVFPCAINRGTQVVVTKDDKLNGVSLSSEDFDYSATVEVSSDATPIGKEWLNYPLGVMVEFAKLGFVVGGYKFNFSGNLPLSAGLSSSASVSVLTAFALNTIFGASLSRQDLALLAQRSENTFINLQCGIMDQFAIAMAQADCAIALDCDTLEHQQVPLNLGDYTIVIGNTNQPRELKGSAYNDRVAECQSALAILSPLTGAQQLAQVTPEQLNEHQQLLTDNVVLNRARHVIEESDRVTRATQALQANKLDAFGQMMLQSHESLRDLFEVSSATLDCMVELAMKTEGVIGSRMTGAGFGGCTVSLVHKNSVERFIQEVGDAYRIAMKLKADFYVTTAMNGVDEVIS